MYVVVLYCTDKGRVKLLLRLLVQVCEQGLYWGWQESLQATPGTLTHKLIPACVCTTPSTRTLHTR